MLNNVELNSVFFFCFSRLCMDNLPDTPNESTTIESSSKSEEDDELDPRVQVRFIEFEFFKFYFI